MSRWFNTVGPCKADIHYMLSPTSRLPDLERLIAQQNYFVIHAPRQTGKTTAMLALAKQLTSSGRYTAVMVSAFGEAPLVIILMPQNWQFSVRGVIQLQSAYPKIYNHLLG